MADQTTATPAPAGCLHEACITNDLCLYREALHDYLQEALGLPDYYGRNLSALADCLAEIAEPTLVTVAVSPAELPAEMQAYVLKLTQMCAREALVNENVNLIVEH